MSRLGNWEAAIVDRLETATIGGSPAFRTVRAVSGGLRPAVRDALLRERMPAAYVGFTFEPTAPETNILRIGAVFSVLVAAQTLRVGSNPRDGDESTPGGFELIDVVRERLDDYVPDMLSVFNSLSVSFEYGDDRTVIYEMMYRAYPYFVSTGPPT